MKVGRDHVFRAGTVALFALTSLWLAAAGLLPKETDRSREGLIGAVRQVTITSGGTTTVRRYDHDGALLETMSRLAPEGEKPSEHDQVRKLTYVYDEDKRRLREMSQEGGEPPYVSRVYAYDAAGRQRAEAAYHMCGTFSSLHVFSYDGDGVLHEQLTYQFRSLLRRVHQHDARGRLTAVLMYKNGALQSTTDYRYDAQGRIRERVELTPGAMGANTTFDYDAEGRLIIERFSNGLDSRLDAVSSYEYDERGNWTRKSTRRSAAEQQAGDSHMEVTERVIEYF